MSAETSSEVTIKASRMENGMYDLERATYGELNQRAPLIKGLTSGIFTFVAAHLANPLLLTNIPLAIGAGLLFAAHSYYFDRRVHDGKRTAA